MYTEHILSILSPGIHNVMYIYVQMYINILYASKTKSRHVTTCVYGISRKSYYILSPSLPPFLPVSLSLTYIGFLLYALFTILVAVYLIYWVSPVYGRTNILVYIAICSLIGSLSVMACKGLSIALKLTLSGNSQLQNPLAWFFALSVAMCIAVQMNYLNKSLDLFNTSLVTPIYYVMFTTLTIVASAILFREWQQLTNGDVIGAICGFLTIVCGVFLLHAFKDINFTLMDLIHSTNRQENGTSSNSSSNNSNNSIGNVGAISLEDPQQPPQRTTSFSRLSSNSQSSLRHGSQTSLTAQDPATDHRTSLTRSPYITNGSVDSGEDEIYSTETAPLVHNNADT